VVKIKLSSLVTMTSMSPFKNRSSTFFFSLQIKILQTGESTSRRAKKRMFFYGEGEKDIPLFISLLYDVE